MVAPIPNNHQDCVTRRGIFIGAAASLITDLCARHRADHKPDGGEPIVVAVWASVCRIRRTHARAQRWLPPQAV
jgi:hypothetical protein